MRRGQTFIHQAPLSISTGSILLWIVKKVSDDPLGLGTRRVASVMRTMEVEYCNPIGNYNG